MFLSISIEHGLDPEKFSIITEAEKHRWVWEASVVTWREI
jgi:hypothetical protein